MSSHDVVHELRVKPGRPVELSARATDDDFGIASDDEALQRSVQELADAQELLYANDTYALLVVFQALDAAGKDGTIKHVLSGVNPQGVDVHSFKAPSAEELDHDFLWRCQRAAPERGRIGIFNRSHYEEVLSVRVHPEYLAAQKLPPNTSRGDELWQRRYDAINAWERHLDDEGTKVVKFFLHVSKEEQRKRLLARLDDPAKNWKFALGDLAERDRWDDYQEAYEQALSATSTSYAPWFVVPADHKRVMRALVAGVLVDQLRSLDLSYPQVSDDQRGALDRARKQLEKDKD